MNIFIRDLSESMRGCQMDFFIRISMMICFGIFLIFFGSSTYSMEKQGLDKIIELALKDSDQFISINLSIDSLKTDFLSRDTSLSSRIEGELSREVDHRDTLALNPDRTLNVDWLGLSYIQPFKTGTQMSILVQNKFKELNAPFEKLNTAYWEFKLSQSLWKNAYGRSVALRLERDRYELNEKTLALEYEKQNLLINIESLYWDMILALKELDLKKESVRYSQIIESWAKKRFTQFAAESVDLIQMQSLVGQRKLDLLIAENRVRQLRSHFLQYFSSVNISNWQFELNEFELERDLYQLVVNTTEGEKQLKTQIPIRIDALSSIYSSKRYKAEALLEKDLNKPEFNFYVSYGGQGENIRTTDSWKRSFLDSNSVAKVGLEFSYYLDMNRQNDQEKAALRMAESNQVRARSMQKISSESWDQLQTDLNSLKEQVKIARMIYEQNKKRISLERRRFQQGKTSTFQMTTAEIEVSESERRFYNLIASLRKTESLARSYIYSNRSIEELGSAL